MVLDALEGGPCSLAELVTATGLARATAHRVATALEDQGLVRRNTDGRFALGLRLMALGRAARDQLPLADVARPTLEALRASTGESVQLFVREGGRRRCVASLESPHGLRWIVPLGALLPLDRGSAGRVLALVGQAGGSTTVHRPGAPGWVESVEERERGVASVSAPVHDPSGSVVAAISVSGPIDRLSDRPGTRYGDAVVRAADLIDGALRNR